jgi:hypothetical protein
VNLFEDPSVPLWFKVINLDEKHFEKSIYADPNAPHGKFRLKDPNILRQLAPGVYESAAAQVREHNDTVLLHGSSKKKYKLGKKIGSIPLVEATLRPELMNDPEAQKRYWQQHPELKCK